ncbi:MAG TPA: META domain-containing protein [Flavisolibacter sp.]|nr:META domain-containing protein [Flavisolibacter sp.]
MASCTTSEKSTLSSSGDYQAMALSPDTITGAKLTFVADQKDYLPMMLGTWLVHAMHRQPAMPEETLYISLQLNEDRTFTAATACGEMKGRYTVKGVSIKFHDAEYNRQKCDDTNQLDEMVRLLSHSVSLYAYNGNMLFLKDNSGNNVFRATR